MDQWSKATSTEILIMSKGMQNYKLQPIMNSDRGWAAGPSMMSTAENSAISTFMAKNLDLSPIRF